MHLEKNPSRIFLPVLGSLSRPVQVLGESKPSTVKPQVYFLLMTGPLSPCYAIKSYNPTYNYGQIQI